MAPARTASPWLHGPVTDLLVGCGLWYFAAFAVLLVSGEQLRTAGQGATWLPLLVLLFSTPHYGATLLRVYEQREDRNAYHWFAVHATLLLIAALALGVHVPLVGSALLTLYMTWSPWHYSGQNYGLAVLFLRRRGVAFDARAKRALYLTFFLSFVLTFLLTHGRGSFSNFTPLSYSDAGYHFIPIGLPQPWTGWAAMAVAVAYVASLGAAVVLLGRAARSLRDLVPSLLLVASQALWFSVPFAARYWRLGFEGGPLGTQQEGWYFLWIAIAHSLQYLWVTSAFAEGRKSWSGLRPYLARTMAAGAGAWVLPALVFSPGLAGRVPFEAGLGALVASVVNIHHFVLDGAIWKLRDGRVARLLLRRSGDDREAATDGRSWVRPAVWTTGAVCCALLFVGYWQSEVALPRALARGDREVSGRILERLPWLGRDTASGHAVFAELELSRGDPAAAERSLQRALALYPKAETWFSLGQIQAGQRRHPEAIASLRAALAIRPDEPAVLFELGRALMATGERQEARAAFERAAVLDPGRRIYRVMAERAAES